MSAKTNNLKIGIFVLIALALLVSGLLAFGAKSFFTPKTRFETAIATEVSGLSVGSSVQLRGVPVGKVTRITFAFNVYPQSKSGHIIVQFEIEGNLLPLLPGMDMKSLVKQADEKGLRAIIKGQGITGTSILALEYLDPTNYPPLALDYTPRDLYIPSAPAIFSRMLESIESSLDKFQDVDFAAITQGVTNALAGVRQLSDKVDKIDFQGIGTNVNGLIVEIKGAVGQIQESIKAMKLDAVSQNANTLITGLQDTNVKLQKVLDKAGAVPMEQTVAELQQTLQTLDGVLLELKRYPSGFFLGEPPRPAGSVQTPPK